MKQEDKQLLLVDLCARLPYGVKVQVTKVPIGLSKDETLTYNRMYSLDESDEYITIKPYLRPLSSMTEEESSELSNIISEWFDKELFYLTEEPFLEYALAKIDYSINPQLFDWLNAHHFDYRGLIAKGLATSTEEFNPYKD